MRYTGRTASRIATLRELIREYTAAVAVAIEDECLLNVLVERDGQTLLTIVDYAWREKWVANTKRVRNLSPGTIRHYDGALARCMDRVIRKGYISSNPLRLLPKYYATYTEADSAVAEKRIDQRAVKCVKGHRDTPFPCALFGTPVSWHSTVGRAECYLVWPCPVLANLCRRGIIGEASVTVVE
jgi:hypothetical protein